MYENNLHSIFPNLPLIIPNLLTLIFLTLPVAVGPVGTSRLNIIRLFIFDDARKTFCFSFVIYRTRGMHDIGY